jgi:hypothetical protein
MNRELIIRALVWEILNDSDSDSSRGWQYQGFGMLRTYLAIDGEDWRLNVWHPDYAVKNVSTIHNHPWDFRSYIISGCLVNTIYEVYEFYGSQYNFGEIVPGPDGGMKREIGSVNLLGSSKEYYADDHYSQPRDVIHSTDTIPGTVTLNLRFNRGEDKALVYWPSGTDWVDAKPRPATQSEIEVFTTAAKKRMKQ